MQNHIVLLLKYYKNFTRKNLRDLMFHINKFLYIILFHTKNHVEHYLIGFLYYLIQDDSLIGITVKHLTVSSKKSCSARYLLGKIYCSKNILYNLSISESYFRSVKRNKIALN